MPYFALTDADRAAMLETIGAASVEDLFAAVPAPLRERAQTEFAAMDAPLSELGIKRFMGALSAKNQSAEPRFRFWAPVITTISSPRSCPRSLRAANF
jgi:glycine dehydrogenase subunit 1